MNDRIPVESHILLHNLLWLRTHYGYSKRKMAAILGIGLWSLNKLENGEIPPRLTVDILFIIHLHFGISPSEMLSKRLSEETSPLCHNHTEKRG